MGTTAQVGRAVTQRAAPWLVTGAGGMLARDVLHGLTARDVPVVAAERSRLDITDRAGVHTMLEQVRPAVVVNCAAWTAVDDAEDFEEQALAVNGAGAGHLAAACGAVGAVLLHVSTDYVFDGDARQPYAEHALTGPRTAYGRSKLAGEREVRAVLPYAGYVVRTAWLYGAGGPSFVSTMLRLERDRETVLAVDDQRGQPTWSRDLAERLVLLGCAALSGTAPAGVYHATATGDTTWYGLAKEVFRLAGADAGRVLPTTTEAFPRPARRPPYSVLGHAGWTAAGLPPLRDWRSALADALPGMLIRESEE